MVVELLYVLDYERTRSDVIHNTDSDDLHIDRRSDLCLLRGPSTDQKLAYKLVIKHDDPGPTIVNFANRGGFDLIVIGSRGIEFFSGE